MGCGGERCRQGLQLERRDIEGMVVWKDHGSKEEWAIDGKM